VLQEVDAPYSAWDNRRVMRIWAVLLLALSGCIEPELGDAPFFCNKGDPECPEGYLCVDGRCVREGFTPQDANGMVDVGPDAPARDTWMPWPDWTVADGPQTDGPVIWWDFGAADMPPPVTDGWPPHFGCQSHADCASDPSAPCCCPMPILPQLWACLPLCLNPFCI
jgi:hypothetical protein